MSFEILERFRRFFKSYYERALLLRLLLVRVIFSTSCLFDSCSPGELQKCTFANTFFHNKLIIVKIPQKTWNLLRNILFSGEHSARQLNDEEVTISKCNTGRCKLRRNSKVSIQMKLSPGNNIFSICALLQLIHMVFYALIWF